MFATRIFQNQNRIASVYAFGLHYSVQRQLCEYRFLLVKDFNNAGYYKAISIFFLLCICHLLFIFLKRQLEEGKHFSII